MSAADPKRRFAPQREPTAKQSAAALALVRAADAEKPGTGWEQLAQVLLLSNEFAFVD